LLVACGIGVATGGGVVLFNYAIHAIQDLAWGPVLLSQGGEWARSMLPREAHLWPLIIAPPAIGGMIVAGLQLTFGEFDAPPPKARNVGGSSSDEAVGGATLEATRMADPGWVGGTQPEQRGSSLLAAEWMQPVVTAAERVGGAVRPFVKATAAAVSLGTGASLGPEGPSVEIGKAFANGLGAGLRSRRRHLTSLLAAGSGAGVAAGFNAPIAGVFFAVETVLRTQQTATDPDDDNDSSGLTIAMVLLAAVLAAVVSQTGLGSAPAFRVPDYKLASPLELPLFLLFGAMCGGVSAVFTYTTKLSVAGFDIVRAAGVPRAVLPILGGTLTGCCAVAYPEVLYQGFNNVNAILKGGHMYEASLLLQILATKVVVTSVCRGSGLVGGIYAPSIFQGAALGSFFGCVVGDLAVPLGLPVAEPQVYALVGVAGMLAANCRVPLTSVLLLFELTRDYALILPTLAAVGLSFWAVQYCLRALAAVAAYTPDFGEERGDEAPPFAVTRDVPFLSLGSMLTSTDEADLITTSSIDQELLDEARSRRQQLGMPVDAPSDSLTATSADPSGGTHPGGSSPEIAVPFPSPTQAAAQTVGSSHVDSAQRQGGGATADVVARGSLQGGLMPQGAQLRRRPGSGHLERPASVVGRLPPALSSALSQGATNGGDTAAALSAQCALEDSCLVFWETTTAEEALDAFETTGRTVGILQDDDSNVVGVLTRDSVLRAIDAAKRGRFESVSDYDGE